MTPAVVIVPLPSNSSHHHHHQPASTTVNGSSSSSAQVRDDIGLQWTIHPGVQNAEATPIREIYAPIRSRTL